MALVRKHGTLITVQGASAQIDLEAAGQLPAEGDSIDLAVIGFANFMSGNYQQLTSNVQDITSTVNINAEQVKKASFALLTTLPSDSAATFSPYGNSVKLTGNKLVIQDKSALIKDDNSGAVSVVTETHDWFANLSVWAGDNDNVIDINGNVRNGQGIGAVLVQAAGAALFKSLGKNAAINNENSIETKQGKLANDLGNAIRESSNNYTQSTMFKRYLDSGRYYHDNADVGSSQAYNFHNANIDFVVQLQGTLSDRDDTLNNVILSRALGTSLSDHKVATTTFNYKLNIFVRLQQRDEL